MRAEALLTEVGRRLAAARESADMSVAETARLAGVSSRYLRMAEHGQANLSLLKLAALSRVLRLPMRELCDLDVAAVPDARIALLGLRGCGKSTVGRLLARHLEVPFTELDGLVEEAAGMDLGNLFRTHGEAYYQHLQREALERWLSQHGSGVLATGGSIVEDDEVFGRIRSTCRTVWLRARPEDHWNRVVAQGDLRPMRNHPRAFDELRALMRERAARYGRADITVDTSGIDPGGTVAKLLTWVRP